jgi:Ca2+-transporting ATPase
VLLPEEDVLDGAELRRIGADELNTRLARVGAFSRVSPEDKLNIVSALQANGQIVAMIGDGVNDAPALRKADIGIAMGSRGTDVAKQAAAVVLQDDRFTTITAAVEEGRIIFENIRKFSFYLFSCNLAEVLVLLIAGLARLPLPLLPLQILWLNLVTDTFPALALAVEPGHARVMQQPPRDPGEGILPPGFVRSVVIYAALITAPTLGVFVWALNDAAPNGSRAVTLAFMTLALAQIFHLGNARSARHVLSAGDAFRNLPALAAVAVATTLQLAAIYFAPLARVLHTTVIAWPDWIVVLAAAATPAVVGQAVRLTRGRSSTRRSGPAVLRPR